MRTTFAWTYEASTLAIFYQYFDYSVIVYVLEQYCQHRGTVSKLLAVVSVYMLIIHFPTFSPKFLDFDVQVFMTAVCKHES